jgi:hypothetical protein
MNPSANPAASTAPVGLKARFLAFSERFGSMLSRVLLTVLYFGVLGPFAIFYRLVADPLHLRARKRGNWTRWESKNDTLTLARRQD